MLISFIKKHRLLTLMFSIIILILICTVIFGIWYMCAVNTITYDDLKRGFFVADDGLTEAQTQELESNLESQGYYAYMPTFNHPISEANKKFYKVYSTINTYLHDYVINNVEKYNNYLQLDYITEIVDNKTLTVTFTGTGYSEKDSDKSESLDKTFVFDISGINASNPDKLPTLISES